VTGVSDIDEPGVRKRVRGEGVYWMDDAREIFVWFPSPPEGVDK
jgi:hypothetical protein